MRIALRLALSFFLLWLAIGLSWAQADNRQPMFGGRPFTSDQAAANEKFVTTATAAAGSRSAAAERAAETGLRYIRQGDLDTAMRRFNQAWLLDDTLPDSYRGFAIITYLRDGDVETAHRLFEMAFERNGAASKGIRHDYRRFLCETGQSARVVLPEYDPAKDISGTCQPGRRSL